MKTEQKKFHGYIPNGNGWYSTEALAKIGIWKHCREFFHQEGKLYRIPFIYMNVKSHINYPIKFIADIEEKLGLPEEKRAIFIKHKNALTILGIRNLNKFWSVHSVRMHLLTTLLRSSIGYYSGYPQTPLKTYSYTGIIKKCNRIQNTKAALERFLQGNTRFNSGGRRFSGWYDAFYLSTKNSRRLIK